MTSPSVNNGHCSPFQSHPSSIPLEFGHILDQQGQYHGNHCIPSHSQQYQAVHAPHPVIGNSQISSIHKEHNPGQQSLGIMDHGDINGFGIKCPFDPDQYTLYYHQGLDLRDRLNEMKRKTLELHALKHRLQRKQKQLKSGNKKLKELYQIQRTQKSKVSSEYTEKRGNHRQSREIPDTNSEGISTISEALDCWLSDTKEGESGTI